MERKLCEPELQAPPFPYQDTWREKLTCAKNESFNIIRTFFFVSPVKSQHYVSLYMQWAVLFVCWFFLIILNVWWRQMPTTWLGSLLTQKTICCSCSRKSLKSFFFFFVLTSKRLKIWRRMLLDTWGQYWRKNNCWNFKIMFEFFISLQHQLSAASNLTSLSLFLCARAARKASAKREISLKSEYKKTIYVSPEYLFQSLLPWHRSMSLRLLKKSFFNAIWSVEKREGREKISLFKFN